MIKVVCFLLLTIIFFPFFAFAQEGNVKIEGKIVDERTLEPIIGAGISLESSKQTGTASDTNGNFSLILQSLPATISINYLGYKKQEVDIYEFTEPIIIYLRENINFLNEIVVVGYGTQKRKELTGAVTSISKETLSQPVVSIDNLLGGAAAGLNITQGGQPGSTFSARIRGGNSINASNEPLYVVDGVILFGNSSTSSGVSQVTANLNPLAALNPNDIENIQILKDVSATAIYGSRGSNGVIIITTKSGKKGRDNIEYQYSIGWQQASKTLDLLDAQGWVALNREIGGAVKLSDAEVAALGRGTDWQDAVLRTAATQTHQISFSGGDDKTRYSFSGNFTDQDGILLNTDFKRYVGRLNLERDVLKNLKVSLNLNASKLNQNGLNEYPSYSYRNNSLDDAIRTSPLVSIYNPDGSFNYANPYETGDLRDGDRVTNAVSTLTNTTAQNHANTLLANVAISYSIIPSLVLKVSGGTNIANATTNYFAPSYTAGGFSSNGLASVGNRRTDVWQYEYTLNYTKQLSKEHYIDALAGYTTQSTVTENATASAANFANEQILWHSLGSGNSREAASSGGSEAILNSYIGRVNYTFREKYNLTATLRADGSSRFAAKHRWGYFPSVGVSWNISDEAFLKNNRKLNELKLRTSLGTVGNQEIGNYQYEATYGATSPYSFNEQLIVGYVRSRPENPDLKWEQTVAYNVGIDAVLFNHRLNITADAYYKKTSDLLLNTPTSIGTGFSSVLRNIGNISNKGVELEVSGTLIDQRKLKWNVSGNIAKNVNKVLKLAGDQENIGNTIRVGHPLNLQYLIVYGGIVQIGDDLTKISPASWQTALSPAFGPGDEWFVNQNPVSDDNPDGDNVVNDNDRVVLGSSTPDITYGFNTTLSYGNLSFYASFQGVSGNKIYNSLRQTLSTPHASYNGLAVLADRWTAENPSTEIPKARTSASVYTSSRFLEDGAYLRLKNITLSYNLPVRIKAAPSSKFRVFLTGQNLLTITDFTGYDPETGGGSSYPLARTISLGVNLSY
ncbi:MAG: TonB-dependent receptor [Dysgonamonadaceae bacterium]|jgi:TonB-linked SusC/RagA family outer membrane protein|nr:TonB-dependent receptor [Dysgonamonadaceae bacterium]